MLYLVDLEELEWRSKDKYLLRILLVACKKSIMKIQDSRSFIYPEGNCCATVTIQSGKKKIEKVEIT